MPGLRSAVMVALCLWAAAPRAAEAQAPPGEIDTRPGLEYGVHDGVSLVGDLYMPKAPGKYPLLIAVHGGGWQGGSRYAYRLWGPYLAQRGYALFTIDYRLAKPSQKSFPEAVHDVRAAIQFARSKAVDLHFDPERIGLIGDSVGAQLAALAALAGDSSSFGPGYPADPYAGVSTKVKVVVAISGIYDLVGQWQHDQIARPRDQIAEKFLGAAPMDNRRLYFDASPVS